MRLVSAYAPVVWGLWTSNIQLRLTATLHNLVRHAIVLFSNDERCDLHVFVQYYLNAGVSACELGEDGNTPLVFLIIQVLYSFNDYFLFKLFSSFSVGFYFSIQFYYCLLLLCASNGHLNSPS